MSGEGDQNKDAPGNHAENETANQGGSSDPQLPPAITSPNPPPPPPSGSTTNQDSHEWRENTKLVLEIIGVLLLLAYTWFTCLQWLQIRYTNYLTARALDGSDKALSQTTAKMQGQIDATNKLYGEAQKQTAQATILAANSGTQAAEAKVSADAATSAAKTAKDALHISERAYLVLGIPIIDFPNKTISFPVINSGHIPSGPVSIVAHWMVYKIDDPTVHSSILAIDHILIKKWEPSSFPSVPIGHEYRMILNLHVIDEAQFNSGNMGFVVVSVMTYNDGFPDSVTQTLTTCVSNRYVSDTKTSVIQPCKNPDVMLNLLISLDGYPATQNKDN